MRRVKKADSFKLYRDLNNSYYAKRKEKQTQPQNEQVALDVFCAGFNDRATYAKDLFAIHDELKTTNKLLRALCASLGVTVDET